MLYNDRSPLENHHCSVAFSLLNRADCNWLNDVFTTPVMKRQFRDTVIELVLSTDFACHFGIINEFKTKLQPSTMDTFLESLTNLETSSTQRQDRTLLMKIIIKSGDVSNPTKKPETYHQWVALVLEEFWRQGDEERAKNISISPFMDRLAASSAMKQKDKESIDSSLMKISNGLDEYTTSIPSNLLLTNTYVASSQLGFINVIVSPIFETIECFTKIPEILSNLQINKETWQNVLKEKPESKETQK